MSNPRGAATFEGIASVCPHANPYAEIDNGHGCFHPEQQEVYINDEGSPEGACRCYCCPLGRVADADDVDDEAVDWSNAYTAPDECLVIDTDDEIWCDYKRYVEFFGLKE